VGEGILVVEEAAGLDFEAANIFVLGTDAKPTAMLSWNSSMGEL
jgi:hypothetical protein